MRQPQSERTITQRLLGRHSFCHGLMLVVAALLSGSVLSEEQDVTELSLENLADTDSSSVTKQAQPLAKSAVGVFVITHEMVCCASSKHVSALLQLAPLLYEKAAQLPHHRYSHWRLSGQHQYKAQLSRIPTSKYVAFLADETSARTIHGPQREVCHAH